MRCVGRPAAAAAGAADASAGASATASQPPVGRRALAADVHLDRVSGSHGNRRRSSAPEAGEETGGPRVKPRTLRPVESKVASMTSDGTVHVWAVP